MSTLEKTIHLLRGLDEKQIEMVYQFILFLISERGDTEERKDNISENKK